MKKITISPLTRIEGHLSIHTEAEAVTTGGKLQYRVASAQCEGDMFRGFEVLLRGRDPLDAQQITQRICGVCPISHGLASIGAQQMAYNMRPNHNGRLLQNLILAANYLQSHVLHFYQLAALDFVDITAILKYGGNDSTLHSLKNWVQSAITRGDSFAAAPFLPRYDGHYVKPLDENWVLIAHYLQALDIRRIAHEAVAVFAGKAPHSTTIVPGGCCQVPSLERILSYRSRLEQIERFVNEVYWPDLLRVAKEFPSYWDLGKGYGHHLSFGMFAMEDNGPATFFPAGAIINDKLEALDINNIREDVKQSRFASNSGLHPSKGETRPDPARGYSWLKAPRYRGFPMEVGPLSRIMVNYYSGGWAKPEVDAVLKVLQLSPGKMCSVLGRHVSRGLEAKWVALQARKWLDELEVDGSPAADFEIPENGSGYGLVEAPRGALGHWLEIKEYKIERYECVVPTTWLCSPRDDEGKPGPVEKALEGVMIENPEHPIEAARVVRSFDPCLACAVH